MAIKRSNWTLWTSSVTPTVNNWRYELIWGYMKPDGTIVEETIFHPETNTATTYVTTTPTRNSDEIINRVLWNGVAITPLSTSDILNARYQAAYNNWDVNLANVYKTLNTENNTYNKIANQVADYYNALAQDVAKREQWLADAKYGVANKLFDDMASQKDYVYGLYGPNGIFTKEINAYYDDLGDYLASEAWREMAYADALWAQSWASIGMMRAQRNQAYNEAFQRSLQVMQQELEAKQNIQQNLINFMTNLRQEYWDTANTYIISQYQRANDLLNTISNNIASTSSQIAAARLSTWGWGWSSTEGQNWDELSTKQKIDLLKKNWYSFGKWIDVDKNWNLLIQNWNETLTISASDLANAWFNWVEHVRSYLSWWVL